ncbi:MAG: thioredoxin family protein [Panacagrimonas sp.]
MKSFSGLALLLFCGLALAKAKVGEPAPSFSVINAQGQTVSLADYSGQRVVLEWTNDGCPFVQKHYNSGNMQGLQQLAAEQDTLWFTVISSAPGKQGHKDGAAAKAMIAAWKASPDAVLLDDSGDVGRAYGAKTTPHMYIIDAEGVLRYAGGIDDIPTANTADIARAENYVRNAMNALARGEPVADAITRPYGCSIKY